MQIPLTLLLSLLIFSSTLFEMAVDRISFSAACEVEKGSATVMTVDTRSLFMLTCEISPRAS